MTALDGPDHQAGAASRRAAAGGPAARATGYGHRAVAGAANAALSNTHRIVAQGALAAGSPTGAGGALPPAARKSLWCRIQAGTPAVLEREAVNDLSRDEEIDRALDAYWHRYRGQVKRRLVLEALTQQGIHVQFADAPVAELEQLAKPGTVREPTREDLLVIPEIQVRVREITKLFEDYDQRARSEYARISDAPVRKEFDGLAKKRGMEPWEYYRWVRKFYFRRGITDPPALINQVRFGAVFLGLDIGGAHPDLIAILAKAEAWLRKMGIRDQVAASITKAYSFVPRPKNNLHGLSGHALGRAIDIDAPRNPHVVGQSAVAIDAILTWLEGRGLAKPWRIKTSLEPVNFSTTREKEIQIIFDKMHDISDSLRLFLETYLDDWLAEASTGKAGEAQAVPLLEEFLRANGALKKAAPRKLNQKKLARIQQIRQYGLITVPLEVAQAIVLGGGHWGDEFTKSKDTMHFEAKPVIPGGPPPPCTKRK